MKSEEKGLCAHVCVFEPRTHVAAMPQWSPSERYAIQTLAFRKRRMVGSKLAVLGRMFETTEGVSLGDLVNTKGLGLASETKRTQRVVRRKLKRTVTKQVRADALKAVDRGHQACLSLCCFFFVIELGVELVWNPRTHTRTHARPPARTHIRPHARPPARPPILPATHRL